MGEIVMVDPSDRIAELDKGNFLGAILQKSEFIQKGYDAGVATAQAHAHPPRPYGLLFAGMGFSGAASDLVKDSATRALDLPFSIVKHYQMPHHVKAGWHLMAVSYSGETEETLSIAREAQKRGIPIIAFTTGGTLATMTDHVVPQPPGYQPRAAAAYTWFSILGYLHESGILPDEIPIAEAIAAAQQVDAECGAHVPLEKNEAKQFAMDIAHLIPQIYATPSMIGVGAHFRGMLNENAKKIADVDLVPECNHNDLTGWGDDPLRKHFTAIALYHGNQNPEIRKRLQFMKERYTEWGVPWHEKVSNPIDSFAEHVIEQARMVQFLDYVSFYTAMIRGVDPSEIRFIRGLKQMLRS